MKKVFGIFLVFGFFISDPSYSNDPPKAPNFQATDDFEVLGISSKSTPEEIQKRYRELSLKHHPDRFVDEAAKIKATEDFKRLSLAVERIRNGNPVRAAPAPGTAGAQAGPRANPNTGSNGPGTGSRPNTPDPITQERLKKINDRAKALRRQINANQLESRVRALASALDEQKDVIRQWQQSDPQIVAKIIEDWIGSLRESSTASFEDFRDLNRALQSLGAQSEFSRIGNINIPTPFRGQAAFESVQTYYDVAKRAQTHMNQGKSAIQALYEASMESVGFTNDPSKTFHVPSEAQRRGLKEIWTRNLSALRGDNRLPPKEVLEEMTFFSKTHGFLDEIYSIATGKNNDPRGQKAMFSALLKIEDDPVRFINKISEGVPMNQRTAMISEIMEELAMQGSDQTLKKVRKWSDLGGVMGQTFKGAFSGPSCRAAYNRIGRL